MGGIEPRCCLKNDRYRFGSSRNNLHWRRTLAYLRVVTAEQKAKLGRGGFSA